MNKEQHVREIEARVSHGVLKTISPANTVCVWMAIVSQDTTISTVDALNTNHSQRTQIKSELTKHRKEEGEERIRPSTYFVIQECICVEWTRVFK